MSLNACSEGSFALISQVSPTALSCGSASFVSFLPSLFSLSPFFFLSSPSFTDLNLLVSIKGLDVCHQENLLPFFPPEKWNRFLLTSARLSSLKGFYY